MTDVFISYAREESATASAVAASLRAAGHGVWIDDEIPAHREYADVIRERIDAAKAVLVIWSRPGTVSQWVRSEANRGREAGKLVQLRIDGSQLPMPFDQIQCVDLPGWAGDAQAPGWRKILGSIEELAGDAARRAAPVADALHRYASIAVIPFKDLSPAKDQGYFCEGIAEEILVNLARLPELRVASPELVGGGNNSLSGVQLARAAGVGALLEGSLRKSGERARIAVRLTDSATGIALWAESFDRDLSDVFALQDEIAGAVVKALGVNLSPAIRMDAGTRGAADPAAYDLYLQGKSLVRQELESERRMAAQLFRRAVATDPGFAKAYAALADVLTEIGRHHPPDWHEAQQEALSAANKAVELAPDLPDAHLARGAALRMVHDPGAEAAYEKAVALSSRDPNVHYRFARFLVLEGRKREAIEQYEMAAALTPDDYRYIVYTLQEYQALGDEEGERRALTQSSEAIERHLKLNPEDVRALGHGAGVLALLGRSEECEEYIERAMRLRPEDAGNIGTLACAAMLDNKPERALALLEQVASTGRGDREWIMQDNDLKPLHGHPRFEALVARMN
jgi:adenylate cyclase